MSSEIDASSSAAAGGDLRLGHRAAVAALELLGERRGERLGDELGLPHRQPVGGAGERPGHAQRQLLGDLLVGDQPRHPLERLEVGLGEHRLVVPDVLEAHGVPEPPGGDRLDARALRHLAASHGGRAAEQHALDPLGDVVVRSRPRGGSAPAGRPTSSGDIRPPSRGQRVAHVDHVAGGHGIRTPVGAHGQSARIVDACRDTVTHRRRPARGPRPRGPRSRRPRRRRSAPPRPARCRRRAGGRGARGRP